MGEKPIENERPVCVKVSPAIVRPLLCSPRPYCDLDLVKPDELILLVAQNNNEIFQIEQAISRRGAALFLRVSRRFEEVCCHFMGIGVYQNRALYPMPSVVLVDLSSQDGERIVRWIRTSSVAPHTPIIGLGNFSEDSVIQKSFDYGVNAYYGKKEGFNELAELLIQIQFTEFHKKTRTIFNDIVKGLDSLRVNPAGKA